MDTLEARYGLTPNDKDALPLREILLRIDEAILRKDVIAYASYVSYWRRYMAVEKLRTTARGVAQTRRAAARADPCIFDKVTERTKYIGGTEFGRGDYAVAVKWWIASADDPEERTYEEWDPSAEDIAACGITVGGETFFIVNSTELRDVGFQMDALDPPPTPVWLLPSAHVAQVLRLSTQPPPAAALSCLRM